MKHGSEIAITSVYANPIHPGHIECFNLAKEKFDYLVVIVNNDQQQMLKIGHIFQDEKFRMRIIRSLHMIDEAILSIDTDETVNKTLEAVFHYWKKLNEDHQISFVKGGDRNITNIPEKETCDRLGIHIVDGLGLKTHNSSDYRK